VAARCGTGRHARRVTSARGGRRYGCGELVALACASGSDWETKAGRTTPQVGGSWCVPGRHAPALLGGLAYQGLRPWQRSCALRAGTVHCPVGTWEGGKVGRWECGRSGRRGDD
jgi:hypothetical protein